MGLADRIALLYAGKIVQIDRPAELYRHPATKFVGGFVGSPPMNFLVMPVTEGRVRLGSLSFAPPTNAATVVMGIRGEDLLIAGDDEGMVFEVRVIEPMGSHTLLTGTVDGQQIRVVAPSDARPGQGTTLRLKPLPDRISWMDAATGAALEAHA
jgi:multiple sugar transport system ATP-binding protein